MDKGVINFEVNLVIQWRKRDDINGLCVTYTVLYERIVDCVVGICYEWR